MSPPGVSEINMKTLSGCANSLCDREVLPAKPGSSGESHYDIRQYR
ncbi:hypothetical protein CV83915_1p0083 (plasmid) [Escherichia coli]|uniref:Uncharacterized protein n=1 Tax=Escherichia coli TaxID=562 RepID=A0A2H4TK85_ECOLX|nr:hypothetical protein CV83915_1p0083 [Escherichia coli]